jgi:hypothetical protein
LVYSASIIKDVARRCETNPSSAFAYFFFDGRDGQKESQTVGSLLRSLIRQFSTPYGGVPSVLTKLYHSFHSGGAQPSVESLETTLLLILEAFDDVFIVLDALDECTERKDVLKWIKQTTSWRQGKLHLLATSRLEEDIAKHLRLLDPNYVYIKQDLVGRDIERYIITILDGEDTFEHWGNEIKAIIKNTVLKSAGGMYALFYCSKQWQSDRYLFKVSISFPTD